MGHDLVHGARQRGRLRSRACSFSRGRVTAFSQQRKSPVAAIPEGSGQCDADNAFRYPSTPRTVQRVVADAFVVHGQFDRMIRQRGCRGVTNVMVDADHPAVPVGRDAENGCAKAMAGNEFSGISVSVSPGKSADSFIF